MANCTICLKASCLKPPVYAGPETEIYDPNDRFSEPQRYSSEADRCRSGHSYELQSRSDVQSRNEDLAFEQLSVQGIDLSRPEMDSMPGNILHQLPPSQSGMMRKQGSASLTSEASSGQKKIHRVETQSTLVDRSFTRRMTKAMTLVKTLTRMKSLLEPTRPDFEGHWVCIHTWGLDAFLKACNISKIQRMAALSAPWPSWEFKQDEGHIAFVNHGPLGDIREDFIVGGPEYGIVDGRKQKVQCKAYWDGTTLVIDRAGPQGRFRELRNIDEDGKLQFVLHGLEEGLTHVKWGRRFERKKH